MADQYVMNWTDGTSFIVQPRTQDITSSSLTIYGKGMRNYGEGIQENLLHLLENFANPQPPANATIGQLWYDTSTSVLNVFNGAWVTAGTDPAFIAALDAHLNDTVAHLNTTENAMLSGLVGSGINPGDLIYLAGLTNNIQAQLDQQTANIASNAAQVAANTANIANKVAKAGDTMTGALSMSNNFIHLLSNPAVGTDATNKASVDSAIFTAFQTLSTSTPGDALYQRRFEVYATAGQSVFTLPWSHVPGSGDLSVYINGVKQVPTAFVETNTTTVTLTVGVAAGDEIMFEKFIFGGGLNPPSGNGISSINQLTQTAPGGTAVFTVPAYTMGMNTLMVWVNGIKQISGVGRSYTETSTTSITFAQNLNSGAVVTAVVLVLMNPSTGPGQPWPGNSEIYREVITATSAGQTLFTLTTPYYHNPSGNLDNAAIDVFINGVCQGGDEIAETNGSSFVTAGGVPIGTVLEFYAYKLS